MDGLLTLKKVEAAQPFMTPSKLSNFKEDQGKELTEIKQSGYGSPMLNMLKMPLLPPTDVKIREIPSFGFKNKNNHA